MNVMNIHASCVALGTMGVLILGESGAGKSDLVLRLIDEGAVLVADDRTDLYVAKGRLSARAPKSIAGLIEVRGLGLIAQPFRKSAILALTVRLGTSERLPKPAFYSPPEGLGAAQLVPLMIVKANAASASARIRLALKAFGRGLFAHDINPSQNNPK
jgi:HPr kinase/phosphorylase